MEDNAPKVPRTWHDSYIEAQVDPFDTRTDKQFCEDIGLDLQTFRNWKSKYRDYVNAEIEKRRNKHKTELRTKAYKALTGKLDKDTNAVKLLFQLLGDLVEKSEVKTEMSDADKIRRLSTLISQVGKKRQAWTEAEGEGSTSASESGPTAQEP